MCEFNVWRMCCVDVVCGVWILCLAYVCSVCRFCVWCPYVWMLCVWCADFVFGVYCVGLCVWCVDFCVWNLYVWILCLQRSWKSVHFRPFTHLNSDTLKDIQPLISYDTEKKAPWANEEFGKYGTAAISTQSDG